MVFKLCFFCLLIFSVLFVIKVSYLLLHRGYVFIMDEVQEEIERSVYDALLISRRQQRDIEEKIASLYEDLDKKYNNLLHQYRNLEFLYAQLAEDYKKLDGKLNKD